MLQLLDDCSASSEEVSADLQSCEANYLSLIEPVENLRGSVSSRKQAIAGNSERTVNGANGLNAGNDPAASPAVLEIQGEN
jgi:hypothetical protein